MFEKKGKKNAQVDEMLPHLEKVGNESTSPCGEGSSQYKRTKKRRAPLSPRGHSRKAGSAMKKRGRPPPSESDAEDVDVTSLTEDRYDTDSVEDVGKRTASKVKKGSTSAKSITEEDCRKHLFALSQPSKKPPIVMKEDVFAIACNLGRDGVNPHRLRLGKDVPKADVEALFGKEMG